MPHTKEEKAAYMKAWRLANKDKVREAFQKWSAENADSRKSYMQSYLAAYNSRDEVQSARRTRNLRNLYQMTPEQFNELWLSQKGECAICKFEMLPKGRESRSVTVDHNHDTGAVRGLLCCACNRGIGNMGDNPGRLESAAAYLRARGSYTKATSKE